MATTNQERQDRQAEDVAYRDAAVRLYPGATVHPMATIQRPAANDGAFVEVTVFVPRSSLPTAEGADDVNK